MNTNCFKTFADGYKGAGGCDGSGLCRENTNDSDYSDGEHDDGTDGHIYYYVPRKFLQYTLRGDLKKVKETRHEDSEYLGDVDKPTSAKGFMKRRALTLAAIGGHQAVATFLITKCKSKLFVPQADMHDNPMFVAINKGDTGFVKLLLKHGWTPELEKGRLCITSVEQAARCGQLGILKLLLGGLWGTLLQAESNPPSAPNLHLFRRAKLLFSSTCRPNNNALIAYLVNTIGLSPTETPFELSPTKAGYVTSRDFIVGQVAQVNLGAFTYLLKDSSLSMSQTLITAIKEATLLRSADHSFDPDADVCAAEDSHTANEDDGDCDGGADGNNDLDLYGEDEEGDERDEVYSVIEYSDDDDQAEMIDDEEEYDEGGNADGTAFVDDGDGEVVDTRTTMEPPAQRCDETICLLDHAVVSEGMYEAYDNGCLKRKTLARIRKHRAFLQGAESGNMAAVVKYSASPKKVDEFDFCGRALISAIRGGQLQVAEYLITERHSALLLTKDCHNNAMFEAIRAGKIRCVRLLIKHGWTPQLEAGLCRTSAEQAAICGKLDILKLLLEGEGTDTDDNAEASVEESEWRGKGLWAETLLCPSRYPDGHRFSCYREVPRRTFEEHRSKLLHLALLSNNFDMLQYLITVVGLKATSEMLFSAAAKPQNLQTIQLLVGPGGLSIVSPDNAGNTPLHSVALIAVDKNLPSWELFKFLLEQGVDISAKNAEGQTPMHLIQQPFVIQALADLGADMQAVSNTGSSVLYCPIGNPVEALLEGSKAKLSEGGQALRDIRDNDGATAALSSASNGDLSLYQLLLGEGGGVQRDFKNRTVLHYAVSLKANHPANWLGLPEIHYSLVPHLITTGVCVPTDVDDDGQTALHCLNVSHYAPLLIQNGWSSNLKDKAGLTPIHNLLLSGNLDPALEVLRQSSNLPPQILGPGQDSFRLERRFSIIVQNITIQNDTSNTGPQPELFDWGLTDTEGRTIAHLAAPHVPVGDYIIAIIAIMNARDMLIKGVKRQRCEAVVGSGNQLQDTLVHVPPQLFTDAKDANGRTPVDCAANAPCPAQWPANVSKFFQMLEPNQQIASKSNEQGGFVF